MARITDKTLAERMLKARERGGYRILPSMRMNAKGYIFLALYSYAVLIVLVFFGLWFGVCTVLGLVVGAFLRDLSWYIGIQRTWPFAAKVTDWDKVQKLAGGLPLTEPGATPNGGPGTRLGDSGAGEGPPSVS
jgi:hypothetical protein